MKIAHWYTFENKCDLKLLKLLLQGLRFSIKINEITLSQYAYTNMNKVVMLNNRISKRLL